MPTNAVPVLRPAEFERDTNTLRARGMAADAGCGSAAIAVRQMIKYKSLGGGIYDAVILAIRPDGRINIETIIPPRSGVFLSRIVLAKDQASAERGEAFVP